MCMQLLVSSNFGCANYQTISWLMLRWRRSLLSKVGRMSRGFRGKLLISLGRGFKWVVCRPGGLCSWTRETCLHAALHKLQPPSRIVHSSTQRGPKLIDQQDDLTQHWHCLFSHPGHSHHHLWSLFEQIRSYFWRNIPPVATALTTIALLGSSEKQYEGWIWSQWTGPIQLSLFWNT